MKRRAIVATLGLFVLLGWLPTATASAADETKQGNTTGAAYVQNLYLWTGDTSRYGQVEAQYGITIMPNTIVYGRWECNAGQQGATYQLNGGLSGHAMTVDESTVTGAFKVLTRENTYCSHHLWSSGGGFRVTSAIVLFWNQEFVGGVGSNPTTGPSATTGPGGSAGPTPSPTPTAAPPDLTCAATGGDDVYSGYIAAQHGDEIRVTYTILGGSLWYGVDLRADTNAGSWSGATSPTTGFSDAHIYGFRFTAPDGHVPGTHVVVRHSTVQVSNIFGTTSDTSGTFRFLCHFNLGSGGARPLVNIDVEYLAGPTYDELASATPTPTPSPSATPAPTCAPGFTWTGTNCASTSTPPWYPPPPPPLEPPETGPNLGGSGGLDDGPFSAANKNGLQECEADDDTYSKPGQAPLRPLNDTSFPGSINPLDYIPWVGNMVSNIPIVVGNTAQWGVNTGADWIIPGACIETLVTDGVDALMVKAPFSIPGDLSDAVTGEFGSAGAASDPSVSIGGTTLTMPFSDMGASMGPWRAIFGAMVWLFGILAAIRLVLGTFGVSNGGSDQT